MPKITILSVQHSGVKFLRKLIKLNFNQDTVPGDKQHLQTGDKIKTYKKLLLIRDGRDVMASTYAGEMQRLDKGEKCKLPEKMSFSEFLRFKYRKDKPNGRLVDSVFYWLLYNWDWEQRGVAGRIQYERLVSEQKRMLGVLGRFLNKKPKGRYVNTQDIVGIPTTWSGYHPAKSNWQKFFNKEDLAYFNSIAASLMRRYLYYD